MELESQMADFDVLEESLIVNNHNGTYSLFSINPYDGNHLLETLFSENEYLEYLRFMDIIE
ncbi:MAG: hypothetical protein ACI35S_03620 [Anaeroplasma sp.]